MIDLGTVRPGSTLYIPFNTFDSNDPSASVTISGLATTDIEVYKNGSVTQRSSDAGYALLDTDGIDFDTTTGIHGISIDLSNNTDSGFYVAGAQYWVIIASITVDAATVNFIAATFRIGYPDALINTTIATLSSQTSFTLTAGPAEDDALNGCVVVLHDIASAVQVGHAVISDYVGSTKTVTLTAATTFTVAAGDNIAIMAPSLQATTAGRTLDVTATGAAGIDWGNVENASTSVDLSATSINLCDTVTTNTDMRGTDNALLAASAPTNFGDLAITATTGLVDVNDKTGYSISGTLTTLDALDTAQDTQHSTTQSAISGLNDPTAAAIADAVWDEALSGHLGAGSTGEALNAAGAAGDPWTTALPGAYGAGSAGYIIGNNIDAAITSRPDAPTIADAVLDEALSGHTTAGTLGKVIGDYVNSSIADLRTVADGIQTDLSNGTDGLGAIKTAVDAIPTSNPTAAAIADAVLDEALAGHVTAGTLGKAVADIEADATLILEDTGTTIPASIAALNDLDAAAVRAAIGMAAANLDTQLSSLSTQASVDVIDGIVDAILVDTDTTIPALIAALNDLAASDILTTQLTESYAADGTAPTLSQAIFLIQQFLFERSVTGTTTTIKKLDGATTAATLTLDDGTSPTSITRAS